MTGRWKVVGLLIVSLICWEMIVRFFVLSPAQEVFDPNLGYIHAPYANILRTYEGYAQFQLDQFGLNNNALPESLPNTRLFVVGDSFVEAYQVMRNENFIGHLNKFWKDSLLFNAGSSGAAPDQSLRMYEKLSLYIQPTHVLLCVNASDLYELLSAQATMDDKSNLQALWRKQDSLSRLKSMKLWLYGHSALVTHLKWKYESGIRAWFTGNDDHIEARKSHILDGKDLEKAIVYWHHVLNRLQKKGVKLTILMMPELEYLPQQQVQKKVRQGRVILTQEAIKMGISVLDSHEVFAQDFEQSGEPAIGFANTHYGQGHINAHGHKILANWLNLQRNIVLR